MVISYKFFSKKTITKKNIFWRIILLSEKKSLERRCFVGDRFILTQHLYSKQNLIEMIDVLGKISGVSKKQLRHLFMKLNYSAYF